MFFEAIAQFMANGFMNPLSFEPLLNLTTCVLFSMLAALCLMEEAKISLNAKGPAVGALMDANAMDQLPS